MQMQLQQHQDLEAQLRDLQMLCDSLQAFEDAERPCSSRGPKDTPCPCQHEVSRTMQAMAAAAAAAQGEALQGAVLCGVARGLAQLGAVLMDGQHIPAATDVVLQAFHR